MAIYVVKKGNLFIRSTPGNADSSNIMAVLHEGTPMEVLDDSDARWWKVEVMVPGIDDLRGYVGKASIVPKASVAIVSESGPKIPAVHYKEGDPAVVRTRIAGPQPLGEAGMPRRMKADGLAIAPLTSFIDWAKVENPANKRWKPRGITFCNIYAYDYCYAAGVFIPRVWWMPAAIKKLQNGADVEVGYGTTVREMNANSLHDWLNDWGGEFGWKRTVDLDELQSQANDGAVAVICGRRKDLSRSGHITVVAPEHDGHKAHRVAGKVQLPLQSQAGMTNVRLGAAGQPTVGKQWWLGAQFDSFVCYYNRKASRWS